jgi:hypothetical protein
MLEQVPAPARQFPLDSIIIPIIRAYISLIYNGHYIVLATDILK